MKFENGIIVLFKEKHPYNNSDVIIGYDNSYARMPEVMIFLKCEYVFLNLEDFRKFINLKKELRYRSSELKIKMLKYYEYLYSIMSKNNRNNKINLSINGSYLDKLSLAC